MRIRRRSPTHPDQQQVQTLLFSTLHPPPSTLHPNPIPGIWHRRHAAQQSFLEAHLSHTALAFVSQAVSEDDSVGLPLFKFIHSVCAKGGEPSLVVLPVRFPTSLFFSSSISLFLGFLKLMCEKIRTQCKELFVSWAIALENISF
jgi:hypothetical protein